MNDVGKAHWYPTCLTLGLLLALTSSLPYASADEPADLTFDDVKFPIEKNEDFTRDFLTAEIKALDGKRIKIRGYIRPSFKQTGIEKFILVRDNQECCFGPGAMLYDCMIVSLNKDAATEFTTRPITVEGEFYLKEFEGPDGKLWAIFRLRKALVL